MHFEVLRFINLKLGRVLIGPQVCGQLFEATRPKVKGHPEVNLPWKHLIATKFGRKNPRLVFWAFVGLNVMQQLARVNQRNKLLSNVLWPTSFARKNPWLECNALLGSKVAQGLAGINHRGNCLGMPHGHQFSRKNPDQSVTHWRGRMSCRGHLGSTRGQLPRNTFKTTKCCQYAVSLGQKNK